MSYDNNNTGAIYPNADGSWSGFITIDDIRMHVSIEDRKVIIRPFRKDNKTPAKRPFAQSRIVRRTSDRGPAGIIPDLDTPLCIWSARDKTYGGLYLQLRPDTKAPIHSNNTIPF